MRIRTATEADWPSILPFLQSIVEAGETYALPTGMTSDEARAAWYAPGHVVVVAVDEAARGVGVDDGTDSADGTAPADGAGGAVTAAAGADASAADASGVVADVVLGSAHYGPNRPARGSHVATASFMVAPEAAGRGVGRALGEYVVSAARAAGFHSMQFNAVVETNVRAVALWHSLGFETLATVPEAFDHPEQGLVGLEVMYRRL